MRLAIAAPLCFLLCSSCLAQGMSPFGEYKRVRAVTHDQDHLEILDATVTQEGIHFEVGGKGSTARHVKNASVGLESPIPMERISYLEVQTGTKAGSYAIAGAAAGAAGALLAVLQVEADPDQELKDSGVVLPVFAVVIGLGAAIGAGVGSNSPVYQTLREDGSWTDNLQLGLQPRPDGLLCVARLSF